ncbi:MAG: MBL fold metallo-hydrolase, partial [Actinomycetota bacterium]
MQIHTIETPSLGDRSYVVANGTTAAVIDPQRDIDRVEKVLDDNGLTVSHVLETHNHNDYVTGGVELARRTGATYVMAADEDTFFDFHGVSDGDELTIAGMRVRVMHTPG